MKLDAICSKPSYYLAISKKDPQNNNLLLHSKGGGIYIYIHTAYANLECLVGFPNQHKLVK